LVAKEAQSNDVLDAFVRKTAEAVVALSPFGMDRFAQIRVAKNAAMNHAESAN
jgi:hypothetical protein